MRLACPFISLVRHRRAAGSAKAAIYALGTGKIIRRRAKPVYILILETDPDRKGRAGGAAA